MSCGRCAGPLISPVLNSACLMVLNDTAKYKLKRRPYPGVHVPSLSVIFIISKKQHQLKMSSQGQSFETELIEDPAWLFHCLFSTSLLSL